jgi:hypothetical protein
MAVGLDASGIVRRSVIARTKRAADGQQKRCLLAFCAAAWAHMNIPKSWTLGC